MSLSTAPSAPIFEHRTDSPAVLGIGSPTPRLSWTIPQAEPGWEQTAYEVEVVRNATPEVYRGSSPDQVLVPWPASPLESRERSVRPTLTEAHFS